jgi:hypothetical protein
LWGVLKREFAKPEIEVEGIGGISAAAMGMVKMVQ